MTAHAIGQASDFCIALVGNPNCGKTALFNLLTGARQKVANYAGVTVERKVGTALLRNGRHVSVIDLPGAYSRVPATPDERVTLEMIEGRRAGEAAPDLIVAVVDATNLRMNLRLVLELKRIGRPMLVALNMVDLAQARGLGDEAEDHLGRGGEALLDLQVGHRRDISSVRARSRRARLACQKSRWLIAQAATPSTAAGRAE